MKKTLIINGFNYPGHTEYLGKVSNKRPLMIMLNNKLKIATLTTHIPISQVPKKITKSNLEKTIKVYKNGVLLDSGTNSISGWQPKNTSVGTDLNIGGFSGPSDYWYEGRIGLIRIYKGKALSAAEVKQNFDALKVRYRL